MEIKSHNQSPLDKGRRQSGTFSFPNQSCRTGDRREVVRHCHINIRSILQLAKKLKFLTSDPAEEVNMPQTKPVAKPVMTQEHILKLIGAIQDMHDLCLRYVGIF